MCRWVGDHGVEAEVELDEAEVFRGELLDGRDLTADFADGADKDVAGDSDESRRRNGRGGREKEPPRRQVRQVSEGAG
jgi:hypothetical protein